tara:strand:+ start:16646 stop:17290 length:645 start_codon:yes stop_codon:yes gene_type:complete
MNLIIVDYKLSNLHSVMAACKQVGLSATISSSPKDIKSSDAIILPGVGSFGSAMRNLESLNLKDSIISHGEEGKPFFGICLGLQLLFKESEEFGKNKGLGILEGTVKKFENKSLNGEKYPVPQIGWNTIESHKQEWKGTHLSNCDTGTYMYFVHSFYVDPFEESIILTKTTYGDQTYCSAIKKDNIFATQFHPEKSGKTGIGVYKNFKEHLENM